ncbi:MAG: DNA repair protein RecO [Holosporaceae bacterium]|jgi:DNA repair protein RecO (recombination protein O)|nr:DNA repair protein RecO [Holosporaceae bacterium]
MQWKEESIILSLKPFSENSRIVTVFNKSMGKTSGLVKGIKSSIQPGDISDVRWNGRTPEQLGTLTIENIFSPFGHVLQKNPEILAIDSVCFLCKNGMPEKAPHPELFDALKSLLLAIALGNWMADYVFFEIKFLSEMGFGLDLSKCVITGATSGLAYISPKTGCAVTAEVGENYRNKLFKLPTFLVSRDHSPQNIDIFCALEITGHFLRRYFYGINNRALPFSRDCLVESIKNIIDGVNL